MSIVREWVDQEISRVPLVIGVSEAAEEMRRFSLKAAKSKYTILLMGESGVGKDHLAEHIHAMGDSGKPFVQVDCGLIPENLVESELFGYARGAFSGAVTAKSGLLETAQGGTLFINEVANLPYSAQAKLLRCVEGKSSRRVGSTEEKKPNARIIIGTNADLQKEVVEKRMRADLYHRLNVISYILPPLRKRMEDIPLLVKYFLSKEDSSKKFSENSLRKMQEYSWPGNVRELRHAVLRALFYSSEDRGALEYVAPVEISEGVVETSLKENRFPTHREAERSYLIRLLEESGGVISKASKLSGLYRPTLYKKIGYFDLKELRKELLST